MVSVYSCRYRLPHPHLTIICVLAISGLLISTTVFFREQERRETWEVRKEQLQRYSMPEISIDFIRQFGHVDDKIEKLSDDVIESMNETELMVTTHSFLDNTDILCRRKMRMGHLGDGGWEVCDDVGVRPQDPHCLVYAFGVVEDYAFEDDMARVYKCETHAFNANNHGTELNRSSRVIVHPFSVGKKSEISTNGKEFYTMKDIRAILGHVDRDIDVMKIDIESNEWTALTQMASNGKLDEVKQLLVEFHIGFPPNEYKLRRAVKLLRDLSRLGFRKFYVHKNPKGSYNHPGYPVARAKNYEVHYLNSNFVRRLNKS